MFSSHEGFLTIVMYHYDNNFREKKSNQILTHYDYTKKMAYDLVWVCPFTLKGVTDRVF